MNTTSEKRIPTDAVRELCGGISDPTLDRWIKDPRKNFPQPARIGRRKYWREADVVAWLDRQTAAAMLAHADALEAEGKQ